MSFSVLLLLACAGPADGPGGVDAAADGFGAITGRICTSGLAGWMEDVEVYTFLDDDGTRARYAYTDPAGRFLLDHLPAGRSYDVFMQLGNARLIDDEVYGIPLEAGQVVEIGDVTCADLGSLDIVIVTGAMDDAEVALRDTGLDNFARVDGHDPLAVGAFLDDPQVMAAFDLLIFESGFVERGVVWSPAGGDPVEAAAVQARLDNLRAFVDDGGVVFATDRAYDVVESAWPDQLDFVGDDLVPDDAQQGPHGSLSAQVTDGALADWLDADHVDLSFPDPGWAVLTSVSDSTSIHLAADITVPGGPELVNDPALVSFRAGDGHVLFSSYSLVANRGQVHADLLAYLASSLGNP